MPPRESDSRYTARRIDAESLTGEDIAAWRRLLGQTAPDGNAFFSPAFVQAAGKAYGRVEVCLLEDSAGLAAVFPYQFPSAFAAAMRAAVRVGENMSDHFAVIARRGFSCSPDELLAWAGLNHFFFTHLDESQTALGLTGDGSTGGLRILLPRGGAAYFEDLRKNDGKFSKDTERRLRKAAQDLGPARFCIEEADAAPWLQRVLTEKREQYLRTGKGDWLALPGRHGLLERLAEAREADCRPIVSTLMYGDTWAAIHFGLRSGKTLHYWFPVYNPALAAYAPGRLLLHQVISHAQQAGIEIIDRGAGESQAKRDFPSERQMFLSGVWHRPSLRTLAYRTYQSAKWRLESRRQSQKN